MKLVSRYKIGPIFTPPVVSKVEGPLGTLMLRDRRRRHELAGRLVRSRDPHLYVNSRRNPASLGLVTPRSGEERHGLRVGQRAHRRADDGADGRGAAAAGRARCALPPAMQPVAAGGGGGRRRGRRRRLTVQGLPIMKPPYGQHQRDRSRTRARSSGRSRTATRPTTSGTIRR